MIEAPLFRPGQLVVCIDDGLPPETDEVIFELNGLTKGRVYTVRWSGIHDNKGDVFIGVRLLELRRPILEDAPVDLPYYAHRFRPVVETRIDALRSILRRVREEA